MNVSIILHFQLEKSEMNSASYQGNLLPSFEVQKKH